MKNQSHPEFNSDREISVAVNNALIMAGRPFSGVISEARLRTLRAYSEALVEPTLSHMEEGLLSAPELVFVHLANALRIQQLEVVGTDKVPGVAASKGLFKGGK